jgi:AcrR family transcriptional regulator
VKPQRRLGAENAKNRALLVDATERVLCEEGYPAVTARRVAEKAGLKVQLVYYYFQTMDDLILAVCRRNTARRLERFVQALASPQPMRALWELSSDPVNAILASELVALANHREAIRTEIVATAKQFRTLQIAAVSQFMAAKGLDQQTYPAAAIVAVTTALARSMVQDTALGMPDGYPEAAALVERGLALFEA